MGNKGHSADPWLNNFSEAECLRFAKLWGEIAYQCAAINVAA